MVWIDGVEHGTTPMQIELDNHTSHTIQLRKEGYEPTTCILNAKIHGGIVVLDVLSGFIPVLIDAATGSWKRLDKTSCVVQLRQSSETP